MDRVALAHQLATDQARSPRVRTEPDGRPRTVRVAMGDPQAPLEKVLAILDRHGLLAASGSLEADVMLVSMGDHFDWGRADQRERAAADGLALFAWLASHAPDQVIMLAGNHDLGRVGELAGFDDETFLAAHREALSAYTTEDEQAERALLARYPALPTAEVAARDFSAFSVAQRDLVLDALQAGRLLAGFALGPTTLLVHAGVTTDFLTGDAVAMADTLNARMAQAVARYDGSPMEIEGLHWPGSAAKGEGRGIFYHRPTSGALSSRRFDPRRIPRGLTQVIGHIGDEKCRELMPEWTYGQPSPGRLRTLVLDEDRVVYGPGVTEGKSRIVFTDGGMNRVETDRYELLDLDLMAPLPTER